MTKVLVVPVGALAVIAALYLLMSLNLAMAQNASNANTVNAINASRHAFDKHQWTAVEIVECIAKQGPYMNMYFRSKDNKFYIPCQMNDGKIGLGIFDEHGNNISAYIPRDGLWQQVKEYILQRAFHYRGPIPPLK